MNILILEEENALRDAVRDALGGNHTIQFAESGQQGFYMASANRYDLMITNIVVPGWNGYKSIDALGTICPKLPVLIWTKAPPDSVRSGLGNRANVTAIVRKQDGIDSLVDAVERAVGGESGGTDNLAKIVCTLGPASCSREIIGHMMLAGMDVARLNFSHGTHADHAETLKEIRAAEEEWNKKVAVLQDLCGPKIRIGEVTGDGCILEKGAIFTIHADDTPGDSDGAGISVPEVLADINPGDPVLLDDGQIELVAEKAVENGVVCRVVEGGLLKSHKGMNLPATRLRLPSVTEKDMADLQWGMENEVDYVALSFVRSADDIKSVRDAIRAGGGFQRIIAKIERPEAVGEIDSIIDASDAVMIARGDMGVELKAARVPWIQKDILERCRKRCKPAITATQMLDSMTRNLRPTRAEVTDVAVAIAQGSDAAMLSGETAVGTDPVNVVRSMAAIISEAEQHLDGPDAESSARLGFAGADTLVKVASFTEAAATLIVDDGTERIIPLSKADYRRHTIFITNSSTRARQACLLHNVVPIHIEEASGFNAIARLALREVARMGILQDGQIVAAIEPAGIAGEHHAGALHLLEV